MSSSASATSSPTATRCSGTKDLSLARLHAMRAGYLLMGVGLALVALPKVLDGSLDAATNDTMVSCSLVVLIIAVTPWRNVWSSYVHGTGDRWH